MDASKNALWDPPRDIAPLEARLVIGELYYTRLLFEDPTNGLLAQTPQVRDLVDRIVFLEGIACDLVLARTWQLPDLQGALHGIQTLPRLH